MKIINDNKNIVIAVVVFIFAIIIYNYFFSGSAPVIDTSGQTVGQDVVALDTSLQTVTLDQSLFSTPGYKALVDFSTPVGQQAKGRPNPFDPI